MAEEDQTGSTRDALGAGSQLGSASDPGPQAPEAPTLGQDQVPAPQDEVAQEAETVVRTILELIGIRARVEVERARGEYYVNIKPQLSKGLLIGRRGTTLRSIQYLTRLIVRRKFPDVPPVMVDIGGYRLRRENFLCKKAEAVARIVLETKREMALDPLTEKERMIVEEHLKAIPEVRIYSVATGSKQNVIIAPK
jgi:spoIIIJ-associated protein